MFKFIFRIISMTVIIIVIIVGLVVWRGGEPFKWAGKKTAGIGRSIEQFGAVVDDLINGFKRNKKKASEKLIELKDTIDSIKGNKEKE
ncbi:MAG: hypothetical protein V3R54_07515 [Thermodesulfovibrionia bacterium]